MFRLASARLIALFVIALAAATPLAGFGDGSSLAVGDVVTVTIDGEKDFTKNYQIGNDGAILLPQNLAPVKLEGLDTSQAAAEIAKAASTVLVNPQVSVVYIQRARMQVFVVGQAVRKPGLVEIGLGDRVLQALAQVGYEETADLSRISVRRGEVIIPVDLSKYLSAEDLTANILLKSGDTIVVPRVDSIGTVMLLGQITKTGSVPITRGMTFRDVMGLVGGVTVDADLDKITIKRDGLPADIAVDYKKAMEADPIANVALQPGDAIYVAQVETPFFTIYGGVNRPGQYPLKAKVTLNEALGMAGGPIPGTGDTRKIQIVRAGKDKQSAGEMLNVNLQKINASGQPEPLIFRGDVINVAAHRPKPSVLETISSLLPFGWLFRR